MAVNGGEKIRRAYYPSIYIFVLTRVIVHTIGPANAQRTFMDLRCAVIICY